MTSKKMDSARGAAHAVTEFFQGNPYGTRIGGQIEQATDPLSSGENWALNIAICDLINTSEEGPRDAIRAIRKRLKDYMGKNNQVVLNSLIILETCVKNCDRRFHQMVAQKEFAQELVKLIGPKYDPPQAIQEKILSLIQVWADAFRGQADLKGVCEVYDELKTKGVEFPATDLDAMAPIYTPKRSVIPSPTPPVPAVQTTPQHSPSRLPAYQQHPQQRHQEAADSGPVHLSPEQLAKLRSELDIVTGNLQVLREMLTELMPGQEDPDDLQLLRDLNGTCRQMQMRMLELFDRVANEEVTSELLLVNDELNNVFAKYDRYMANRHKEERHQDEPPKYQPMAQQPTKAPTASSMTPAAAAVPKPSTAVDTGPSLIDFGSGGDEGDDLLSRQLAAMGISGTQINALPQTTAAASSEFDMFNQTRGSSMEQARQGGSTYYDNSTGLDQTSMGLGTVAQQRSHLYTGNASAASAAAPAPASSQQQPSAAMKESDYKEMEAWLQQQPPSQAPPGAQQQDEFDNFLSRRAEVGASITPIQSQSQQQRPNQEQQKKEDERMFSL